MNADPFSKGHVDAATAVDLVARSGLGQQAFLRSQIERAKAVSRPELSHYRVGAVGLGASGAIYLGANIEVAGRELCHTVHAEQSVVVSAMMNGERRLSALAISAAPCGSCRQFLRELAEADTLEILLDDDRFFTLGDFLPDSFGPEDLGVTGALLDQPTRSFTAREVNIASGGPEEAAVGAAARSYAPYTGSYAGCALVLADGSVWPGSYIENAAFNPSVAPAQSALVTMTMAGREWSDIRAAIVAQVEGSRIDHADATGQMLGAMGRSIDPVRIDLTT